MTKQRPSSRDRWLRRGWLAGLVMAMLVPFEARQPAPEAPIVAGGNLLDGTGAPERRNVDIFIADGAISAIVDAGTRAFPRGARVIDARNRWIVPGLIDSHVHYRPWMAELLLYHGVTSVFDLGNRMEILQEREVLRSGRVAGPRLFVAGQGLEGPVPGSPADASPGPLRTRVVSAADAGARAAALLDQGVDAIKIREWIPAEWIRAVTTVAHARNKPVLGHLNTPVHEALDAGLDALIHPYAVDQSTLVDPAALEFIRANRPQFAQRAGYYPFHLLDPSRYAPLIASMVQKKVYFNPTFGNQFRGVFAEGPEFDRYDATFLDLHAQELGYLVAPLKKTFVPYFGLSRAPDADATQRKQHEEGMEDVAELMRQFSRAGGRMIAGTDSSGPPGMPGVRLHRELQMWAARGIAPMEVLRAATQYPAEMLRQPELGTLQVGKQADLVLLKGNPLDDIRLLGSIDTVLLAGRVVPRTLNAASLRRALETN